MSATISEPNSSQIQVSGAYKDFTGDSGSTTTVIQYDSGEAPASGDAGRFLMWRVDTSLTGTWQIRYIESATATTVTVGDGGFSSAPPNGAEFRMSSNLEDIKDGIGNASKLRANGTHYEFANREWVLTNGAFVADVDKSIGMTNKNNSQWQPPAFQVRRECAIQFGRLKGGEANNSVETTQGCRLALKSTSKNKLIFGTKIGDDTEGADAYDATGSILNFYGCQIEASHGAKPLFIRAGGPLRMIGTICDGDIGGRFYHEASELVDCRFSGNTSGGHSWSSATTLTRDIDNAFFFGNNTAIKAYQGFDATFKNCRFSDSNNTIINADGSADLNFKFIDCTTFANNKISANKGNYTQGKSINYEITDSGGTGLDDVLVAVYDKNGLVQTGVQTSSSGAVSEIQAIFFNKPHGSGASNLAPFDIRVRKYGYTYLGFASLVSDKIKQEIRLVVDSELASTETEAQAISGISLNFATSTLTITEDSNTQELYDYYKYQLAQSANMQYADTFVKAGDGFNIDDWDLVVDGCVYTGDVTTTETITLQNGGSVVGTTTDKNGTIARLAYSITGLVQHSRIQIYNLTTSAEIYNSAVNATSYSAQYIDGTAITTGDEIRLRVTRQSGATAYLPFESTAIATASGFSFKVSQQLDAVYNANAIDGSSVSTLTSDFPNVQIDVDDADGSCDVREIYARYVNIITTEEGLRQWFGGITAINAVNYQVNTQIADLTIQNVGANGVNLGVARIFRDDGAIILAQGTAPITQDNGEFVQFIQPQINGAMNTNAKLDGVSKNTNLIPALL